MVILIVRFKSQLTRDSTLTYMEHKHLLNETYGTLRGCFNCVCRSILLELTEKLTLVINKKICYNLYKFYKYIINNYNNIIINIL